MTDPNIQPGQLGPRAVAPEGASWYHVSNRKMRPGTILKPRGGRSPYGDIYKKRDTDPALRGILGPTQDFTGRDDWVWMEHHLPAARMRNGKYLYRVEPESGQGPHPWNDLGQDGWVTPSARVIEHIPARYGSRR